VAYNAPGSSEVGDVRCCGIFGWLGFGAFGSNDAHFGLSISDRPTMTSMRLRTALITSTIEVVRKEGDLEDGERGIGSNRDTVAWDVGSRPWPDGLLWSVTLNG
jgi:hypothetical protein